MVLAWYVPRALGLIWVVFWGLAVCHRASVRCTKSLWPRLLVFAAVCRIGEASHPGPTSSNFVLGIFNPSGLPGKAPYIVSHLAHGDIWAISETHLCQQSMGQFKSSLHFAQSPFQYCVGGHPVPPQKNRMFHSAWRGVAVLSKHPTRQVPTCLPAGVHESSRTVVTTTLLHDTWVTGATVYGEPESSSYPHQKTNNEALLHSVANHVCHLATGPRFVAGDWNVTCHSLPVFSQLEAAGFQDLQDIANRIMPCGLTLKTVLPCSCPFRSRFSKKDVPVPDSPSQFFRGRSLLPKRLDLEKRPPNLLVHLFGMHNG